jgi:hypothetical protein
VSISSLKRPTVPKEWRKLFADHLPGYDPIETAGDCWFDAKAADSVCLFFENELTHIEGELAGTPLILEPWQKAIQGCAFGWKRPNGMRRYREVFDYVPRKNGKTTRLGGLINCVAFCDDEPGAQIYSAAAEREQAALVYRQAKGMILNNPRLSDGVKIYSTYKSMEFPNEPRPRGRAVDINRLSPATAGLVHHHSRLRTAKHLQREVRIRLQGPRRHHRRPEFSPGDL